MKTSIFKKATLIILSLLLSIHAFSQECLSVNDFEEETIGPLGDAQFGGYYNAFGSPQYVEENCTPDGQIGVRLHANTGIGGDIVGYTQTFGINPQPTFLTGLTYQIAGVKLLSEISTGSYEDITMHIELVGDGGIDPIISKALSLEPGICETWDPMQFISPGDYNSLNIIFTATSLEGVHELFIVIDDWCIEPVDLACEVDIEWEDTGCGEYKVYALSESEITSYNWAVTSPTGVITQDTENPLCFSASELGQHQIDLVVICANGEVDEISTTIDLSGDIEGPIAENCQNGETITIEGVEIDMECIGEFTIPDPLWFDASPIVWEKCYFDKTEVTPGQIVSKPAGTYLLFCEAIDVCEIKSECIVTVEILCNNEPCDIICCQDGPNWDVPNVPSGPVGNSNPTGFYPEYGSPEYVDGGCKGSAKSIALNGVTSGYQGDAVGIRNNGFPPTPMFQAGNTYCISYCLKSLPGTTLNPELTLHASNTQQTNSTCTGSCKVIGTSDIVQPSDGWTEQQILFTPGIDYDHFLMINANSGILDVPNVLLIDDVCISTEIEEVPCNVDILIEEVECGKVLVNVEECGEVSDIVIIYNDGIEINDTTACIVYDNPGPWTVAVNYTCDDGILRTKSKTFTIDAAYLPPVISCPSDTTIVASPELECIAEYTLGSYTISDTNATVTCYLSGILVANPSLPVSIPQGVAQVMYIAQNECGADTCTYDITVNCGGGDDKYDCPIDVLFVLDNSGSIDGNEFTSMGTSALAEISAISGVYTNAKFGVLHYSGACGDKISIEHDFQSASGITTINRQFSTVFPGYSDDLNDALGATINALTPIPDPNILSGTLTPDAAADLYLVIFTDAGRNFINADGCTNSALVPFTNSNILKNSFGANISIVHFSPGFADNTCGAIASAGGNYLGPVEPNPGDPFNSILPRQYIPSNFGTPNIDLLDILPPCEICYNCDDLDISIELTDEEKCCYSVDINNGIGTNIVKLEAEIISPDWDFNSATTNPGSGFQWTLGTTPTAKKVCVSDTSGSIPLGASSDVLEYCFSSALSSPSPSQTVVFRWYSYNGELFELECTDTLFTECQGPVDDPCITVVPSVSCNADNAYVYDVNLTITNNSGSDATHVSLNGLPPGYEFGLCSNNSSSPVLGIPIPGGLLDGATTTICVKIYAPIPVLNPKTICFNAGIYSFMGECCHEPTLVCIDIDPCCDPCEDISISYSSITLPDNEQCCYSLSIDYECDYLVFDKIKFTSQTPGVTFGYHALGNTNFQMCGSTNQELCVTPLSTPLAKGNYANVLDICLDGISDPSQIPQLITVDYLSIDPATNEDTITCSDELEFTCQFGENECLETSDQSLICIPDSNKYRYTFTVTNRSTIPFNATDVTVFVMSPSDLHFVPTGGIFPLSPTLGSNQSQTITGCLESISSTFPSTATELVLGYRLSYLTGDTCCYESILDTIPIPPCDFDDDCFSVIDIEPKNVVCDTFDCYENPFCLPWLVSEINNQNCAGIATASVQKAKYNGDPVFLINTAFYDMTTAKIYSCDGSLIQDCFWTVPPPATPCNPDAGIDIITDLTDKQTIWNCSDPLPVYDASACASMMSVDFCVKIRNNASSGSATTIDLSALIPPGVVISPSTIPISLAAGSTTTVNFTVSGAILPSDLVKVKGILSGTTSSGEMYECMDTMYLVIPTCPQDECCVDEDEFNNNLAAGFQVTQLGDCTFQVCANQFDTCHYFSNPGPDWGDGTILLQVISPSNPPNNCWTYTYPTPGTYKISLGVAEIGSDGEFCWGGALCSTVEADCCTDDPCDNVDITTQPISQSEDSCCYKISVDNNFCDDYFKGFRIELDAPSSISQIQSLNGYIISQISPTIAEVRPPLGGLVPLGIQDVFTLCNTNFSTNPHIVSISWLVPLPGGGCEAVCAEDFEFECAVAPENKKCYDIVEDSIHCESNTYCFKIENTSQPGFIIQSIDLYDLTSGLVLSPSGRINIPALSSGQVSDWICFQYNGVSPGDNPCFKLSAHNTPVGFPPTQCCTDTIETCFVVPECDPSACGLCPDGNSPGTNLVQNGDFESGYSGFSSGYAQQIAGLMNSNQFSIRNSTDLVNGQWSAVDHTTGSATGQFLAIDGPSTNVAYSTFVNVVPNTDYVFCGYFDNLINTLIPSAPVIEITIGSQVLEAGRILNKSPDGWQLYTYSFNSGSASGLIALEIRDLSSSGYNDWAIDDISVGRCETTVVDDCCDNIDATAICTYYENNIFVQNGECIGCVVVDLDSCDRAFIEFDGAFVPYTDLDTVCYNFGTGGVFIVPIIIERLDLDGNPCFNKAFDIEFNIEGCSPDDCCMVSEEEFCDYYDLNIISSSNECDGCIEVALDSCDVGHVDFGNGPIPLQSNTLICNEFLGNGSYTVVVTIERLAADGSVCFTKDFTKIIEVESCPPPSGGCLTLIDGELDCDNEMYCFRVVNNTTAPGFSFKSIALVNESQSHSFNPDPISIPELNPGDTSAILCINYLGSSPGDTLCFDLVGHKEDLGVGEEPTFCCASTNRYCFVDDCETTSDPCCDMTMDELLDYLEQGANHQTSGCQMCLPFEVDSCMVLYISFGDGEEMEYFGGGTICHDYPDSDTYEVNIQAERYGIDGEECITAEYDFTVITSCPTPPECNVSDLEIYNAISPNGDGLNDNLVISGGSDCTKNIKIYNRWGQMVWQQSDYQNDWIGQSFSNKKLPDGTYFLVVELPEIVDNDARMKQVFIDIRSSK